MYNWFLESVYKMFGLLQNKEPNSVKGIAALVFNLWKLFFKSRMITMSSNGLAK